MREHYEFNKVIKQNETIFINFENRRTPDFHRILNNLVDKINLKICDKYVALSTLSITMHGKI